MGGTIQMVLAGDKSVASYNPRDGSRLWYLDGPTLRGENTLYCIGLRPASP